MSVCVCVCVCVCLGLASFRSFAVASARSLRLFRIPGPTRNSSISEPLKLDTGGSIKKRIGGSKTSTTLSERLREAIGCSGLEVWFAGGKTLNPKVVKVATSETHESVPALSECACRNPKNSAQGLGLEARLAQHVQLRESLAKILFLRPLSFFCGFCRKLKLPPRAQLVRALQNNHGTWNGL